MTTEFIVTLENQPGKLAELGETLGHANVNVEAIHGAIGNGEEGLLHIVVDDIGGATQALQAAGITFRTREVLAVNVLNEPGMMGDVARVMSAADINIDTVYVTVGGTVILGVDDLPGAMQVASGMAVSTI